MPTDTEFQWEPALLGTGLGESTAQQYQSCPSHAKHYRKKLWFHSLTLVKDKLGVWTKKGTMWCLLNQCHRALSREPGLSCLLGGNKYLHCPLCINGDHLRSLLHGDNKVHILYASWGVSRFHWGPLASRSLPTLAMARSLLSVHLDANRDCRIHKHPLEIIIWYPVFSFQNSASEPQLRHCLNEMWSPSHIIQNDLVTAKIIRYNKNQ